MDQEISKTRTESHAILTTTATRHQSLNDKVPRGHIKLSRKQFNGSDALWDDGTPFDSRSAWVWLLQLASWKDSPYHTAFRLDMLKRGEFVASFRYLGGRWKWGKNRVSRYLKMLEKAGRIAGQRAGHHGTVYLIVNYDSYQSGAVSSGTATGTVSGTISGQSRDKVEAVKEGEAYTADFELLWKAYPKRHGGSNKAGSYTRFLGHLKNGVAFDIMFEGVKRYALLCISDGSVGTKYVKDCETFLGPKKCFLDEHTIGFADTSGVLPLDKAARDAAQFKKRGYV